MYVLMCVCMYVCTDGCIHVCMYVCTYVCMNGWMDGCTISMYVPLCATVRLPIHSSLSLFLHPSSLLVCLSVCPSIRLLSVTPSFCLFLYPVQTSAVPTVRSCFFSNSRTGRLSYLYCCLLSSKNFFQCRGS
jgi:hypothetical protein